MASRPPITVIVVVRWIVLLEVINVAIQILLKVILIKQACVGPNIAIVEVLNVVAIIGLSSQVLRLENVVTCNISG